MFEGGSEILLTLEMTMDDINLILCKITSTQIEILNLIDNVHRPKDVRMKRSLSPFDRLFHFLFRLQKTRMSNQ